MWLLRATKAFAHLFPAEMEQELARHVAYERWVATSILSRSYVLLGTDNHYTCGFKTYA